MIFDWDAGKAKRNLAKHGVSFEEASEALFDPLSITIDDVTHSDNEDRYQTIGQSGRRRVLFVIHTKREGNVVWIISARKADRQEVRDYEAEIEERFGR